MQKKQFSYFIQLVSLLALTVIILGAYTRLTNAGLGCPDWPGCYGHLTGMGAPEPIKAWTEMVHRYLAGTLALMIFLVTLLSFMYRRQWQISIYLPCALVGVVIFQALLGMWTVTLKLLPIVVMGHLLGGLTTLALLWLLRLSLLPKNERHPHQAMLTVAALGGVVIVALQIALGGWVSSNYAGLACVGFPTCNGQLVPPMAFEHAFSLFAIGPNFQGGVLSIEERMAIQMVHRVGAILTVTYILWFASSLWRKAPSSLRRLAILLLLIVLTQFSLGVLNVTYLLPLPVAVLHNAVGALLLLTMVTVWQRLRHTKERIK